MGNNDKMTDQDYKLKELETDIAEDETEEVKMPKEIAKITNEALKPVPDSRITIKNNNTGQSIAINEKDLKKILSEDDFAYYCEKMNLYLLAYPDLSDPFDIDDLDRMVKEQIFQNNLLKKKRKYPSIDISEEYDKSDKRTDKIKDSLAMRRKDRIKKGGNKKNVVNISTMSVNLTDKDKVSEMERNMSRMREEEDKLRLGGKIIE